MQNASSRATDRGGPRHALITGASGGLGRALAVALAGPDRCLSLWGRNEERLRSVAEACSRKGAVCSLLARDSRDFSGCREQLRELDRSHPVDLALLNAGVSSGLLADGRLEPVEDACRTLEVNATGTVNMAAALLENMAARGRGHIVIISSLAGLYPLPGSPSYSAAKAALSCYGRALGVEARARGARVSVVYPGYVESPMSKRLQGPQPFRWTAEKAAAHILSRLEAGKDSIAFPFPLYLGIRLLHLLPGPLAEFFVQRFTFTVVPDQDSPLADAGPAPPDAPDA